MYFNKNNQIFSFNVNLIIQQKGEENIINQLKKNKGHILKKNLITFVYYEKINLFSLKDI